MVADSGPGDGGGDHAGHSEPVLEMSDFSVVYRTLGGDVRAVDHVNLFLRPGEVVGLAGESGSGKSTLAYGACRLLRAPAVITSGSVIYRGRRMAQPVDILAQSKEEPGPCAGGRSPLFSRAP